MSRRSTGPKRGGGPRGGPRHGAAQTEIRAPTGRDGPHVHCLSKRANGWIRHIERMAEWHLIAGGAKSHKQVHNEQAQTVNGSRRR